MAATEGNGGIEFLEIVVLLSAPFSSDVELDAALSISCISKLFR